jgi:uncharacterized protein YqgQ
MSGFLDKNVYVKMEKIEKRSRKDEKHKDRKCLYKKQFC